MRSVGGRAAPQYQRLTRRRPGRVMPRFELAPAPGPGVSYCETFPGSGTLGTKDPRSTRPDVLPTADTDLEWVYWRSGTRTPPQVGGGQLSYTSAGLTGSMFSTHASQSLLATDDQWVEFDWTIGNAHSSHGSQVWVYLRGLRDAFGSFASPVGGTDHWILVRFDYDTFFTVGLTVRARWVDDPNGYSIHGQTVDVDATSPVGSRFRAECEGTTVRAYRDGVLLLEEVQGGPAPQNWSGDIGPSGWTGQQVGVGMGQGAAGTWSIDNFCYGDLGVDPP